ncbi:hypothetical protein U9M48_027100, partial [Paspalum notatum var. saurae]
MGVDKMLETDALSKGTLFGRKQGEFSTDIARRMAIDRNTPPAAWWAIFGGDTPVLQRVARRLLSQCVSSSGCERNWSTFAYIHTKLRNRLSHKKLDKLVFVNYNLRLRLDRASKGADPYDYDPVTSFMDLSLYRRNTIIEDWMVQDSSYSTPNRMFTDIGRAHGDEKDVEAWAEKTVGDTHLGKRKTRLPPEQKGKKPRPNDDDEEDIGSQDTTPEPSGGEGDGDGDGDSNDDSGDNDGGGSAIRTRTTVVLAHLPVRRISPMPPKIRIMEHPYHNDDTQGPHVDVVDVLALHTMMIAQTRLRCSVAATMRRERLRVFLHRKGAFVATTKPNRDSAPGTSSTKSKGKASRGDGMQERPRGAKSPLYWVQTTIVFYSIRHLKLALPLEATLEYVITKRKIILVLMYSNQPMIYGSFYPVDVCSSWAWASLDQAQGAKALF